MINMGNVVEINREEYWKVIYQIKLDYCDLKLGVQRPGPRNNKAKTLILEGTKEAIVAGKPFEAESAAIEVPVNGVIGLVLKRPITAIKAGLAPAKEAGVKEDLATLTSLLKENQKDRRKITKSDYPDYGPAPNALGPNGKQLDLDSLVYKGRPLNGIWATAPFLHNGSVPNLWELLVTPEERVKEFWVGSHELDPVNVGFITYEGKNKFKVNGSNGQIMPGNSNLGHNYGTSLSDEDKWNLIEYMKTL